DRTPAPRQAGRRVHARRVSGDVSLEEPACGGPLRGESVRCGPLGLTGGPRHPQRAPKARALDDVARRERARGILHPHADPPAPIRRAGHPRLATALRTRVCAVEARWTRVPPSRLAPLPRDPAPSRTSARRIRARGGVHAVPRSSRASLRAALWIRGVGPALA